MFNFQSIALAAALYGLHHARTASAQAGCQPAWQSGDDYELGDMVASTITISGTTTTGRFNFECERDAVFCGQRNPADPVHGSTVWKMKSGACAGTATVTPPIVPAPWPGAGCPALFASGTAYDEGSVVSVDMGAFSLVYQCSDGPNHLFCPMQGFAPGTGVNSEQAWTELGSCTGTISPTISPINVVLMDAGGCPESYMAGVLYDEGDTVENDGLVYECMAFPLGLHCSQAGYEPGVGVAFETAWSVVGHCDGTIMPTSSPSFVTIPDVGGCPEIFVANAEYGEGDMVANDGLVYECMAFPQGLHCPQAGYEPGVGIAFEDAWSVVGHCSGTIQPTSSPSFVTLTDMGGCPDTWSLRTSSDPYEEGDTAEANGLVFKCRMWPFSGFCGQAGYEPLVNPATPDAWKDAWQLVGFCSGSIGPTTSPTFDALESVGACPEEWVQGDAFSYDPDDMASITVSEMPLRKVVYKCRPSPSSNHCGQHQPDEFGGDLGWSLVGSCDGSTGPTSSPSFDALTFISDPSGCPQEFSTTEMYEAGNNVSVTVSTSPQRKVVYECRQWPNSGYCNQQGTSLDPGQKFGHLGWILLGACTGTLVPTMSPTLYVGTCQFTQCMTETSCNPGDTAANAISGTTDCSCGVDDEESTLCTQTTCTMEDVDPYNSSTSYAVGDVVRLVTQQYTCKVPGWCDQDVYKPEMDDGIWRDAWTKDGVCM